MKRMAALFIVGIFILSAASVLAETPKERASSGMNDLLYGPVETPQNINETKSKGAAVSPTFTDGTKTGVDRGLARIGSGIWKIATFWYADTTYKTAQKNPTK